MIVSDSKKEETSSHIDQRIVLKLWIPFICLVVLFISFIIVIMSKLSWKYHIALGVILSGVTIRWLSKRIMYMGSSRYLNNDSLHNETERLKDKLLHTIKRVKDSLKSDSRIQTATISDCITVFTNIVNMIGDDIPKWNSSIVVTLNKIISILNHIIDTNHVESKDIEKLHYLFDELELFMNENFFNPPILSSFKDYFIKSSFWRTLWLALFPNPSFVTYSMLQRRLHWYWDLDIKQLQTPDGVLISVFVFLPSKKHSNNSKFVLLASPNACIAETNYSYRDPQLSFYLSQGYYVVAYDYRGFGGSTGDVTPDNTVSDGKLIVQMMMDDYHASLHIVHGTSIGGYVVSGLTDQSPISIYDRNFVNMDELVECMVPQPLPTLVHWLRRWPMNVIANVNMNKPTVIVFDPRDEIVHFPASLFMGLTNQLCPQDSFVVEEHIHSQYKTFLVAVKDILMEEGMTFTQFVRKFMTRRSDPSACHDTSPNLFILYLCLQLEIEGIPLVDVVNDDLSNESTESFDLLLRIITVWRGRLYNSSDALEIEEVIQMMTDDSLGGSQSEQFNALLMMITQIKGLCDKENTIVPETFHVLAIHTGHNSNIRKDGWKLIDSVINPSTNVCGLEKDDNWIVSFNKQLIAVSLQTHSLHSVIIHLYSSKHPYKIQMTMYLR